MGNPFGTSATPSKPFYRLNEEGSELNANAETSSVDAMEGIFVIATEDGETMIFTTNEPDSNGKSMLALNLIQGRGVIDRTILRFDKGTELPKFQLDPNNTKLYIPQGMKDYAIVNAEAQGEVPVNFKAKENGSYTISVNLENMEVRYLHLIDNLTGADVDLLANSNYSFEAKTTDYASRFRLVFSTICEDADGDNKSFAFISNGQIIITDTDVNSMLQIMDVMGHVVRTVGLAQSGSRTTTSGMTPGVYILRLIENNDVKTQKIVVR